MSVHIQRELCKGCELCVYFCPVDILELGSETNSKGYQVARVTSPEDCTQCKMCEMNCPDLAIVVTE